MLAKTTIAPLDRTKIYFQTDPGAPFSTRAVFEYLGKTWRNDGFMALFRGFHGNYIQKLLFYIATTLFVLFPRQLCDNGAHHSLRSDTIHGAWAVQKGAWKRKQYGAVFGWGAGWDYRAVADVINLIEVNDLFNCFFVAIDTLWTLYVLDWLSIRNTSIFLFVCLRFLFICLFVAIFILFCLLPFFLFFCLLPFF